MLVTGFKDQTLTLIKEIYEYGQIYLRNIDNSVILGSLIKQKMAKSILKYSSVQLLKNFQ